MNTLSSLAWMAPTGGGSTGLLILVIQFGALIGIFYFLLILPQKKARAKHAALLAGLKKGDEVVTAGGIVGKVRDIKDNRVTIESGTSNLVIERNRITQVGDQVAPASSQ